MSQDRRQDFAHPPGPQPKQDRKDKGDGWEVESPSRVGQLRMQFSVLRGDEQAILAVLRRVPWLDRFNARIALYQALCGPYFGGGAKAIELCEQVFGKGAVDFPSERVYWEQASAAAKEPGVSTPAPTPQKAPAPPTWEALRAQTLRELLVHRVRSGDRPDEKELDLLLGGLELGVVARALLRMKEQVVPGDPASPTCSTVLWERERSYNLRSQFPYYIQSLPPGPETVKSKTDRAHEVPRFATEPLTVPRFAGQHVLGSWETSAYKTRPAPDLNDSAFRALGETGGEPLPEALLQRMNRLFAHDFSDVRIHTDAQAARAAALLGARALAVGRHIYFAQGHFTPGTPAGDRLLVHELMHVVQFDQGRLPTVDGPGLELSKPEDATEQEAQTASRRLEESNRVGSAPATPPAPRTWSEPLAEHPWRSPQPRAADPSEHEADRYADAAVAGSALRPLPSDDDRAAKDRTLEPISPSTPSASTDVLVPSVGGQPLAERTQRELEAHFGSQLNNVRVFTGNEAADAARAMRAHAYTVGTNIVFGENQYATDTLAGRWLLTHEVAHVLQQRLSPPRLQRFEAGIHESIELHALTTDASGGAGGLSLEEASAAYFGNWMRDFNQVFVPLLVGILEPDVLLAAVNYLAQRKFGRTVTAEQFGYYIPAEHLDSPAGLVARHDLLPGPPAVADPGSAQRRPPRLDTPQEPVEPGATVLGADLFSADQSGVMAHIRRTNLHVERRLELAVEWGRTPDGLMSFGAALHAVEDLFAHSNWIEIAIDRVLGQNPGLVPELRGDDRHVFTYTQRTGEGADGRPILTTGSFTGRDTQISVGSELVSLLQRPLQPPRSDAQATAEQRFTSELLRALSSRLRSNAAFRAAIRSAIIDSLPTTLRRTPGLGAVVDGILQLPLQQIYDWTRLPRVPSWVRDAVGVTALQQAIRQVISTQVLRPAASRIQAAAGEQRVAQTSLLHSLADSRRIATQGPSTSERAQMATQERLGGAPVAQQEQQARTEAGDRVRTLEATPEPIVAGPSHSQLSKDHPDSPFFGLAVTLATVADRRLRDRLLQAWSEAAGRPTTPFAFPPRPADPALATLYDERMAELGERQHRGAEIVQHGRELPAAAYDIAAMRRRDSAQVRATAAALRAVAGAPDQAATQVAALRRALGSHPDGGVLDQLATGLDQARRAILRGGAHVDDVLALRQLADQLDADAARIEAAGRSPTVAEREQANTELRAARSAAATQFGSSPAVDRALAALVLYALDQAIASTAPAYEQHQRDVLEGRAHVDGVTQRAVPRSTITLPDLGRHPPALRALLQESRRLIGHPYDDTWWVAVVTEFVRTNSAQIAAEVTARNRGYSAFRRP